MGGYYPPIQNCENNYNITLGNNMFFTLQTVYTKGERRFAVLYNKIINKQKNRLSYDNLFSYVIFTVWQIYFN